MMGRIKGIAIDMIDAEEWDAAFPQNENFLDEMIESRSYEIQELFIEGHGAREIAQILELPLTLVLSCLDTFGVDEKDADPA
jgi:hypothetical protein